MDFRCLKAVIEDEGEFLDESSELPQNKTEGPYENLEEYLKTHFMLVREDLLCPYRQAVKELRRIKNRNFSTRLLNDIQVYKNVVMKSMRAHNSGMEYVLKFGSAEGHCHVDWVNAKLLMYNSLLCFSCDGFESFFWGVVSTRRVGELEEGVIGVRGVERLEMILERGVEYTMFESTNAYFEAYQNVLKALQRKEMERIDFLGNFVFLQSEVEAPRYLESGGSGGWEEGENGRNDSGWEEKPVSSNGGMATGWGNGSADGVEAMDVDRSGEAGDGWGRQCGYMEREGRMDICCCEVANNCAVGNGDAKSRSQEGENIAVKGSMERGWGGGGNNYAVGNEDTQSKNHGKGKITVDGRMERGLDADWVRGDTNCAVRNENPRIRNQGREDIAVEGRIVRGLDGGSGSWAVVNDNSRHRNRGKEKDSVELVIGHSQAEEEVRFIGSLDGDIDYSQEAAIKHGLTKKLAIIQGPAGTGKTFVGLYIAEQLLANRKVSQPIVVVCYTNRALDQFLEGIYKYESCLVRLGTGTKSPILQDCSLEKFQRKLRINLPRDLRNEKGRLRNIREEFAAKLNFCIKCMYADSVTPEALFKVAEDKHIDSLYFCDYCRNDDIYRSWVTGNDKIHPNPTCPHSTGDSATGRTIERQSLRLEGIEDKDDPLSIELILEYKNLNDVWVLDASSRQMLDQHWLHKIQLYGQKQFWDLTPQYEDICNQWIKMQSKIQQYILGHAKILGMTTTVAARYFDILYAIKPQVMIVEEAAEVLEGQLLACLNPHIEHLILIGDHLQLRPFVASSQLAFDYHLDVSLFERLVVNGIEYKTLEVQRRMRPAIAYLLSVFYPNLKDHRCVQTLDNVKGVHHNVFFLDHTNVESCVDNSGSKSNAGEADLVVEFAMYLIDKCGYSSKEITILSMYRSQASEISRRFKNCFSRKGRDHVSDNEVGSPRVRSVDEFQGEESNIIILSLVRNTPQTEELFLSDQLPPTESIGFLGTPNRICVALSRAKLGFYMFGNASLLAEKSQIWDDIVSCLSGRGWIGPRMKLYCPNHEDTEVRVRKAEDLSSFSCGKKCKGTLKCGHSCSRICHVGCHENLSCASICGRPLERCGHLCMKMCHSDVMDACYPCVKCNRFE